MSIYLIFRKLKTYKNIYILYIINEKRVVLKKLGQISYFIQDFSLFFLHINLFLFYKLLNNGCFISEYFFLFLQKLIN